MIENLKRNWPLLLLIAASLLIPANQGAVIAAVISVWVLGWALSNRNDSGLVFVTSVALVVIGVAAIFHMSTLQIGLWQGYLPMALAADVSFITSMVANQKNK